jgi:AraC-like DNA-binding protein
VLTARWIDHAFAPHLHDFYAVSLNYGGRGVFDCRRQVHDAAPGTCNLVGPGEMHTGRAASTQGWTYRNLHIDVPAMGRLRDSVGARGSRDFHFTRASVTDPVLAERLRLLFASAEASESRLQNESLLLEVVARLVSLHLCDVQGPGATGREHASVGKVRAWLDMHSDQNVSLGTLADLAGLSPYYLVRAFRQQVGVPPHQYLKIVRVHRARKLLASGAPPSEAAHLAGFCDQSHLNRCFKAIFGVPPGRYVSAHRAGHRPRVS